MDRTKGILIAIDDSEASRRAVAYVARMMGGRKGFCIRLFHVLAPLPPRLVDFPVGEDPGSTWRREAGAKDVRAAVLSLLVERRMPASGDSSGVTSMWQTS